MALSIDSLLKQMKSDVKKPQKKIAKSGADTSAVQSKSSFAEQLDLNSRINSTESMEETIKTLRELVNTAGEELERNPTLGNYHIYRAVLGDIVKRVVQGSLEVKNVGMGYTSKDKHQIIRHIDEESEQLLELVISEQKDRLKITSSISTIKGLVIDLLS